jgi:3-oxoacyl-[acyl-carrier protein] reductase
MEAAVTLVTGSARGLGRAVARALGARGDRVHVVWRGAAGDLEREFPGRVHHADLGEPGAAEALVAAVLARDGRLDHVVHAVGEYTSGPLETLDPDDLGRMFESNVATTFRIARAARAALRASSGDLVAFGCAGLAGLRARRETAAYAAAKSALVVLVRSLALEEAPHGVRANLVSPGIVPHEHADPDTLDPARIARIPLGRAGRPEEVAAAVAWLSSSDAGHVTGQNLEVAGGWML